MAESIILTTDQAPGDAVMLTAAVRDLKKAYPDDFDIDVRTAHIQLFENNPYLTMLDSRDPAVRVIPTSYPLYRTAKAGWWDCCYHFAHAYRKYLEELLGLSIPQTALKGDIHLSPQEMDRDVSIRKAFGIREPYWVLNAGGKADFTTKLWPSEAYRAVVRAFAAQGQGYTRFVQVGASMDLHTPLYEPNVTCLLGKTDLRQLCTLVYHSLGVVTPVSLAMHLAAAVPCSDPKALRPCVVIAGGRENPTWEHYPGHDFLDTCGMLDCCTEGPCWKARIRKQPTGKDPVTRRKVHDPLNDSLCARVQQCLGSAVAECMAMITPHDVIRCIRRRM